MKYRKDDDPRKQDALVREKQREDRFRDAGFEVVRYTWDDRRSAAASSWQHRVLRAFAAGPRPSSPCVP